MSPRIAGAVEVFNRARRRLEQRTDQAWALATRFARGGGLQAPFDAVPRFALLTVNYSTTSFLKLMLRSLVEQQELDRLVAVVICDNHSRDGGLPFLRELSRTARRVMLVENRWWTSHGRGMRAAIRALDRFDGENPPARRANVLLACDPDVVFLRADTLSALAGVFRDASVSFAGQLRQNLYPLPEAQASFLAVRRDWAARRDVSPWVNHGSPAYWMQRDIWLRGGTGADFRSYEHGYVLHRGRSAVAAARELDPWSSYGTTDNRHPHYTGMPGGREIWSAREQELARWLESEAEPELLRLLAERLS